MRLTREQTRKLLNTVNLPLPAKENVKRYGQHEYLMRSGAKITVLYEGKLRYLLYGYAQDLSDVNSTLSLL